jgi:hypothetical protein
MDNAEFARLLAATREAIAAGDTVGRMLVRVFTPVLDDLARWYDALPREVKIAVNDRRATPIATKKIRRYLRTKARA